jgi:hypothetical protein
MAVIGQLKWPRTHGQHSVLAVFEARGERRGRAEENTDFELINEEKDKATDG